MSTYHVDPDGRPDSMKVIEYVILENRTDSEKDLPLTVKNPKFAEYLYIWFDVVIEYMYVPLGS